MTMMRFARWLRQNSEHYLLIAAQRDVAARYGHPCPRPREGFKGRFFLNLFAPVYRGLPWRFRAFVLHSMPGSHRQSWTPRARRPLGPAV
ncbi:MAG TPA: hypothetical protein VK306_10275 [Acidimicrobiales bacterium]|nr:hypothetical protein [Acidimicrobiales bacterium]